jgi:Type VI secretion system/phage-baseplate injector OB domain
MHNAEQMEKYYGKFRGLVRNNIDPMGRGRIQAEVPSISETMLSWCTPCVPYSQDFRETAIPPVGTNVWIEFERGDLDFPIWSGCYW